MENRSPNPDRPAAGAQQQVELALLAMEDLPALPAVLGRLERLARDGSAGALAAAREIIACDPALLAGRLRVGALPRGTPAGVVEGLAAIDDLDAAALLELSLTCPHVDDDAAPLTGATGWTGFWRHCLATAEAAGQLAQAAGLPVDRREAYACGLLHDIGKLALAGCFPKAYARALSSALDDGDLAASEREVLAVDHAWAGRRLAEAWRLPEAVAQVIWLHHLPAPALAALPEGRLAAVVALGDLLATRAGLGWHSRSAADELAQRAEALGLTNETVEATAADLPRAVEAAARRIGLDDSPPASDDRPRQLATMLRQCRRRQHNLEGEARATQALRQLSTLTARAGAAEALQAVARCLAEAMGAGSVTTYSLCDGELLACRWRAGQSEFRAAAVAAVVPAGVAAEPSLQPAAAMSQLAGAAGLDEWLSPSDLHLALTADGRQVGGAFVDARHPASPAVAAALGGLLGLVLDGVQQRHRLRDLGEQMARAAELVAQAQQAVTEARTLSAIAEIAAGAAHELNNPLAVVSGRAQLMARKADSPEQRKAWSQVAEQAQRISDIVTDLMEFARPPSPQRQAVNPLSLLEDAKKAFLKSLGRKSRRVAVDIQGGETVSDIMVDAGQLTSVLVELLRNALAAGGEGVSVVLSAGMDESGRVVMTCGDNGPGMDESTLSAAMVPFFSSQPAGRSRGMGLPRSRRYVEVNGGRLWIRSRPQEGTTVAMEFPPAPSAGAGGAHAQRHCGTDTGGG